jgi:hypothetical protein
VNPTVSELTLDWLNEFALITSIADVPDDQGGHVMIRLTRSGYDFADETEHPITDYHVWLRVDEAGARTAIQSEGSRLFEERFGDDLALLGWRGRYYLAVPHGGVRGGMPPGIWASVGGFPAVPQDEYSFIAETLSDSTGAGTAWAVYCVTAHTANPIDWYASYPDSGYSVDNLAPAVPTGLIFSGPFVLEWDAAPEPDFAYHTIYGSEDPVFDPTATLLGYTVDPTYDVSGAIFDFYHVTTSDHGGNESEAASIEAQASSMPENDPLPIRFAFRAPQPSPFRSQALLGFDLPAAERVQLVIYDAAGRQVRVLASGMHQAGQHRISWDGENEEGQPLAPGVYFARIRVGEFEESRRLAKIQ